MRDLSEGEFEILRHARAIAEERGEAQVDVVPFVLAVLDLRPQVVTHWRAQGIDADAIRQELERTRRRHNWRGDGAGRFSAGNAQLAVTTGVAEILRSWRATAPSNDASRLGVADLARGLLSYIPRAADAAGVPTGTTDSAIANADIDTDDGLSPVLAEHGSNLVKLAALGMLDPLIGREREVNEIIRVLSRKKKRNPVLIGDAGVGKTVIVEGVAQRICAGDVPKALVDARLVALSLSSVLGGTRYRGEFEARLHSIIDEVASDARPTLLFLDEFHLVSRAGAAEGGLDMGSLLLTAMARGDVSVIGATTPDEFDEHVGRRGPLARRIQVIHVGEPDRAESLRILRGLRSTYESFHLVSIEDAALVSAVELSWRERRGYGRMPDVALDLLDDACATAQMTASNDAPVLVTAALIAEVARERSVPRPARLRMSGLLRRDRSNRRF